jgi:hypothetical protein
VLFDPLDVTITPSNTTDDGPISDAIELTRHAKEAGAETVAVDLGVPGREGAERLAAAVRAATAGA